MIAWLWADYSRYTRIVMDKGSTGIIALSNIEFREASEKELWRTYLAVIFQSAMKIA
jgi:hypothetical protein